VASYPTKYNRLLGLVEMKHLLQNVKKQEDDPMSAFGDSDVLLGT
jgi:hypothetical protein